VVGLAVAISRTQAAIASTASAAKTSIPSRAGMRVTIEIADVSALVPLLQAGLGIALLPHSLLPRDQRLQTRRLATPLSWRVVIASWSNRPVRSAARAFAELVASSRSSS